MNKKELINRNSFKGSEAKYMPLGINTPSFIEVFDDTTIIAIPSERPISIEIKNKNVAESFKSYFESLWKTKK